MKASDRPVVNPLVVLREETDEWAILFNPDTNDAVGINPVGVQIWKLIDGKSDVEAIHRKLKKRFRKVPERSLDQVKAFVDELAEMGFVGLEP